MQRENVELPIPMNAIGRRDHHETTAVRGAESARSLASERRECFETMLRRSHRVQHHGAFFERREHDVVLARAFEFPDAREWTLPGNAVRRCSIAEIRTGLA